MEATDEDPTERRRGGEGGVGEGARRSVKDGGVSEGKDDDDDESNNNNNSNDPTLRSLRETIQKVEASLSVAIEEHVTSKEFDASKDGLDFLDVKNSMLLSYLIDLTYHTRNRIMKEAGMPPLQRSSSKKSEAGDDDSDDDEEEEEEADPCYASWKRLTAMKTAIDKMRGLDKKLRYQIDKLLAAGSTSSSFAVGGPDEGDDDDRGEGVASAAPEDPLQFRPDVGSMLRNDDDDDEEESGSSSSDSGDDDDDDVDEEERSDREDDLDEDLAAARMTLSMASTKARKNKSKKGDDDGDQDDESGGGGGDGPSGLYRAPRLTAVPYTHDGADRDAERRRRKLKKMRASELAQALRSRYGDAPEQEDAGGGTDFGRQREASRRLAEREAERTRYEEDTMVRLTASREERRERRRLLRAESSNLAAISDLGNLVRDADFGRGRGDDDDDDHRRARIPVGPDDYDDAGRHANGKRKRQLYDQDGKPLQQRRGKKGMPRARNSLQAELFGGGGGSSSSKKKKKTKR